MLECFAETLIIVVNNEQSSVKYQQRCNILNIYNKSWFGVISGINIHGYIATDPSDLVYVETRGLISHLFFSAIREYGRH